MIKFLIGKTIKRKLMLIIMLACSVALLLACAGILFYEIAGMRQIMRRNTEVMASVIGANSSAALFFQNSEDAQETLAALKGEPHVLAAALYTKEGKVIATYFQNGTRIDLPPLQDEGVSFNEDRLNLFHKISWDGESVGTLFIQSDLRVIQDRVRQYLAIITVVMASSSLVAFLLSLRLQKLISVPVSNLAEVANKVASQKNYSIRASKVSDDEMGVLIDRFNEMLAGIQERDAALLRAHEDLEHRVDERTKELQLEITQRSRIEAELRLSQQKFETLVNSIEGVVWEADPKTFEFAFVSPQSEKLLGYPRTEWTMDPGFWLDHIHPDDQVLAHEIRMKGLAQEKSNQLEYRMVASDGRVVWVKEISTFTFENGAPRALRGVLFDITEQKHSEEELDLLNKRLLESTRHAGMAEVATGVLHNVGNVLNSVNVSSTLICDQVRNSRAARLKDVVLLMNKNAGDLGTFMTVDPKGKIIPGYLSSLSERLTAEQQDLLKEIELLMKNVEHIKEIVAMQQNYAKVSGIIETLSMRNLIEDALQMNAAALSRHGILVVREYEEVPMISVDKHKVLQILVNLIRNAKYAIDAAARRDKRITISIRMNELNKVELSLKDSGIGIDPDNLTRIFSHGFTTKRDGHGFGLHSGALAAKEMGGSLTAFSEGMGKGATFTLELPLTAPKSVDSRNGGGSRHEASNTGNRR